MKPKTLSPRHLRFLVLAVSTAAFTGAARAADFTWDGGGGDNNWGTAGNWNPDGAPSPGSGNNLIFAGTTRLTPQNNYGDGDDFQNITFDSTAGAFTIGNTGSNGIDWFGNIANNSGNTQTIGFRLYQSASNAIDATSGNITLNSSALLFRNGQNLTLTAASGKTIQIDSVIANGGGGGSAISVNGAGTVKLSGANTFTSGISITNGTLSVGADNNLGASAGGVLLNGGTLSVAVPGSSITNSHVITVGTGGGTLNIANSNGSGTPTFSIGNAGNLTGSGTLTVTGGGPLVTGVGADVLVMGNANAGFSGNVIIQDGGIIEYANAGAIASGTFTVGDKGMLSANNVTVSRAIALNAVGTLAFQNNNSSVFSGAINLAGAATVRMQDWWSSAVRNGSINGNITGTGPLAINSGSGSGGIVALGGTNDFSGGLTITNATVLAGISNWNGTATNGSGNSSLAGQSGSLGSGAVTLNTGGILQLGYRTASNTGTATVSQDIVLNGGKILANDSFQHLTGGMSVTGGGTLGSTYEGSSGSWNKGLFVDGVVSGTGALTLQPAIAAGAANGWGNGSGNLYNTSIVMFTNAANTYSGTISVAGGATQGSTNYLGVNASTTLQYATVNVTGTNSGNNHQWGTSPLLFQAGLGDAFTLGALSGNSPVALTSINEATLAAGGAVALTVGGNNGNTIYSGVMSGPGSLTKTGTGAFTLSGANNYTGDTKVTGGTLALGNNLALQNSALDTSGAGAVDVSGFAIPTFGGLVGSTNLASVITTGYSGVTTLTLNPGTGVSNTYSGGIANGAAGMSLTKTGPGTQILSGTNSYTGATNINGGTLGLGNANALAGGGNIVFGGGTLQYSASNIVDYSGRIAGSGSAISIDTNGQSVSFGSSLASSNTGGLTKTGPGTLKLAGTNTYSGATSIGAGTLEFQGAAAMSGASGITIANGGTLSLRADADTTFAPSSLSMNTGGTNNFLVNNLTMGSQTHTIVNNASLGNGNTTINVTSNTGGTLQFGSNFGVSANNSTAWGGPTTAFNLTGVDVILNGMTASDGRMSLSSTTGNSLTINGNVSWSASPRTIGATVDSGVLTLNNTTSGGGGTNWGFFVTLNDGTLNINNNFAIAANANSGNNGGAGLKIGGGTLNNTSGSAKTLSANPTLRFDGDFAFSTAGGTSANDLNLGTGAVSLGIIAGATRTITANGSATLTLGGVISNGTNGTTPTVNLTKAGAGILALTGANTYTGATNVNAGILAINGNQTSATGAVNVNSTGTLKGVGIIGGAVIVAGSAGSGNQAIYAPGNSVGSQTIANDLIFGQHSIFEWELGSNTESDRGTNFDAVNLTDAGSDLSIDETLSTGAVFKIILGTDFDENDSFWTSTRSWDVFSVAGTSSSQFKNFALYNASNTATPVDYSTFGAFSYGFDSGTGTLTWSAVPEPTSALAGLLIAAGLLRRRRQSAWTRGYVSENFPKLRRSLEARK